MTVKQTVRIDLYRLISDAVDSGVERGWRKAHKHTDTPVSDDIISTIQEAVMDELSGFIKFDEEEA